MNCVAFKPDDPNMLVSGSSDGTIKMWGITSGLCVSTLRCHRYVPSHSREYFLSCFSTNLVCLSSHVVSCLAFKPDNPNILVSGSDDKTIKMWDITSGSMLSTLKVDGSVSSLDFSPCGTKIAATSNNYPKFEIKIFILNPLSGDWEIGSEPPLRGHRYVPSLSRECFLSCFRY